MSRDVGSYAETKATINAIESRESGAMDSGPAAKLDTPYTGGKVHPSGKDFAKPSTGTMRRHLE